MNVKELRNQLGELVVAGHGERRVTGVKIRGEGFVIHFEPLRPWWRFWG